jgi:hypothetical protein
MDPSEQLARAAFEQITGRRLTEWDVPPRVGAVDFRCQDEPTVSLEVKRVTVESFHAALARVDEHGTFLPSQNLSKRWLILAEAPTRNRPRALPDIKRWRDQGEAVLVALESRGITCSQDAAPEFHPSQGFYGPMMDFHRLFGDALALAHDATPNMPPGIDFHASWGYSCPDDPNILAAAVDEFVTGSSKEAVNLRDKLERSTDDKRHAFLVVSLAVDEAWLFDRWGANRLPSEPLTLPDFIDRAWVTVGGATTWWFEEATWHGATPPTSSLTT